MLRLGRPRRMGHVPGEHNVYFYQPRGVALVIAPWNFPLAILTGMTSAALVAGNPVIVKPAGPTPLIAAQLARLLEAAGAPPGTVNYLPSPGAEVGDFLVRHPGVDLIAFTGSMEVGLRIISQAAQSPAADGVKKVIAEMGGKNAIIVDADADLDVAVSEVIASAFHYAGQKCSAASRVIVLESAYDDFVGDCSRRPAASWWAARRRPVARRTRDHRRRQGEDRRLHRAGQARGDAGGRRRAARGRLARRRLLRRAPRLRRRRAPTRSSPKRRSSAPWSPS